MQDTQDYAHHLYIRVVVEDFEMWYREHSGQSAVRATYGLADGPVYRDLDNPNAAIFHLKTDDLTRALKWFKTPEFREATRRAKVQAREFYDTARRTKREARALA